MSEPVFAADSNRAKRNHRVTNDCLQTRDAALFLENPSHYVFGNAQTRSPFQATFSPTASKSTSQYFREIGR